MNKKEKKNTRTKTKTFWTTAKQNIAAQVKIEIGGKISIWRLVLFSETKSNFSAAD